MRREGTAAARASARRFFKPAVKAHGVYTALVREIVDEILPVFRNWPAREQRLFCEELWRGGMLEEGILVTQIYRKLSRGLGEREFRMIGGWLDRYVDNWAACDGLCIYPLAAVVAREPKLARELEGWARSGSRWKRRASLAGLVREARRGRCLPQIRRTIRKLESDPEDIVRKAVVWLKRTIQPHIPAGGRSDRS